MMNCGKCGKTIADDTAFCPYCGMRVNREAQIEPKVNFCISCGRKLPQDAKFCSSCGKPINRNSFIENPKRKIEQTPRTNQTSLGNQGQQGMIKLQGEKDKMAAYLDDNSFVKQWLFKICGAVAFIGMFFPILDYGFFTIGFLDIFKMTDMGDEVAVVLFFMLIHGALAFGLMVFKKPIEIRNASAGGVVLLLVFRILPNLIVGLSLESEMGFGYGADYFQYGSGWIIMFIPFVVAAVVSVLLVDREKKMKRGGKIA